MAKANGNQHSNLQWAERSWQSDDGLTLCYRDYDNGSQAISVMCLHGLTRCARDYDELASHLASSRRVIVPDFRGHGRSDYARDAASYAFENYVTDIAVLLKELALPEIIFIGTSLGGLVTMLLAQRRAENGEGPHIAGAVINDIGPEIDPAGLERMREQSGQMRNYPTWIHAASAARQMHGASFPDYGTEDWISEVKRNMVVGQNGRITADYDLLVSEPLNEDQPGAAGGQDLWDAFEALSNTPLTIFRGALSDIFAADTFARMLEQATDSVGIVVDSVGHNPTLRGQQELDAIDALIERAQSK